MIVLNKISQFLNRTLLIIGGIFLMSMILLTCANILFRATWVPIRGTFELMGFFGAIVTAFSLGATQQKRRHIAVDVLVNRFPKRTRQIVTVINNLLCMSFFGIAAWQLVKKATTLRNAGEVTETLRIIYYPFIYSVALGCAVLTLIFFTDVMQLLFGKRNTTL